MAYGQRPFNLEILWTACGRFLPAPAPQYLPQIQPNTTRFIDSMRAPSNRGKIGAGRGNVVRTETESRKLPMTYELLALVGVAVAVLFGSGAHYDLEILVRERVLKQE